jgi:hypothetical protein
MKNIHNFEEFLFERYKAAGNDYAVGDIVLIRYFLTGDPTPVKIINKKSKNYFIVSHKVENSPFYNAPDHGIHANEIISRYSGVGDPVDATQRYIMNPNIRPDTSGIMPGWNSWNNDINTQLVTTDTKYTFP